MQNQLLKNSLIIALSFALSISSKVFAENYAIQDTQPTQQNSSDSRWPQQSYLNNLSKTLFPDTGLTIFAKNWFRFSDWNFFDPGPGGGNPDYSYFSNRLRFGAKLKQDTWSAEASLQYVRQFSLPDDASGSSGGALGLGAVYFGQNGDTSLESLYVKYLNVTANNIGGSGVDVTLGRFDYGGGVETYSGVDKIDWLKRVRIDSRLIGGFGWSIYQRSFDGIKLEYGTDLGFLSLTAFRPTQGGFETNANVHISKINVLANSFTFKPDTLLPNSELQVFHYYFDDQRAIDARIDNSGLSTPNGRQDISIHSLGGHIASYKPIHQSGVADFLIWGVYQTGDWFEQNHNAYGLAIEGGYQFTKVWGKPWIRIGTYRGSGDDNPNDNNHETLHQMLPTARKYSFTTTYNLMNNTDHFIQLLLSPHPKLKLRTDIHRVFVTESADLLYGGAGATQARGSIQGFAGRPTGGDNAVATSLELTVQYQLTDTINIHGFFGKVFGDEIIQNSFTDDADLEFFFLETSLDF